MLDPSPEPPKLLTVTAYAKRMRITRAAVYKQLADGRCLVAPIVGIKPPKWRSVDVDALLFGGEAK